MWLRFRVEKGIIGLMGWVGFCPHGRKLRSPVFCKSFFPGHNPVHATRIRRYFKNLRVESDDVRKCWKSSGSSRVGSGRFQVSRVGPGHADTIRPARNYLTCEEPRFFGM